MLNAVFFYYFRHSTLSAYTVDCEVFVCLISRATNLFMFQDLIQMFQILYV